MITHKYPLYRPYIGISHRGTLVGVHPTIPWFICCGFCHLEVPWFSPLFHHHRHLPSLCATSKPMTLICQSLGFFNIWGCGGWFWIIFVGDFWWFWMTFWGFLMICLMNLGPYWSRVCGESEAGTMNQILIICWCAVADVVVNAFQGFFGMGNQGVLKTFLWVCFTPCQDSTFNGRFLVCGTLSCESRATGSSSSSSSSSPSSPLKIDSSFTQNLCNIYRCSSETRWTQGLLLRSYHQSVACVSWHICRAIEQRRKNDTLVVLG